MVEVQQEGCLCLHSMRGSKGCCKGSCHGLARVLQVQQVSEFPARLSVLQTGCKELSPCLQLRPGLTGKLPMRRGRGP